MSDPMGPLDALFLHMEDGTSHMHIGSCSVFAGPPPSIAELTAMIESKLPILTRYRQRVRFVPGHLGHPVWVDDPHFNLSYHVRHSALPPPGDQQDLDNLMGRIMSQELDRHRPLWELWMIEGLPDERWALIAKVHHCMVDGVSGTDLMNLLLDTDPAATRRPIEPWEPSPAPSALELVTDAAAGMLIRPVHHLLSIGVDSAYPQQLWNRVRELASGFRSLAPRMVLPAGRVSIEGNIGPQRRWTSCRYSLADVKAIRSAFGGSVNDVVLTAITGALRAVLVERGEAVEGTVVRSLVPVSLRRADDHSWNNQVSLILADLPVGVAEPVARLEAVHAQMATLKSSHQVAAGQAVVGAAELVPPALLALTVRGVMALIRRAPQRIINTVTTNVPGPQYPLYAVGREMLEYMPFVPLSEGVRVGVAILSYNGQLTFGITGDYDTAPDVRFMAEQIEAELGALRARAGRSRMTTSGHRLEGVS